MDQNQIKNIKKLASEFFQAARAYVCRSSGTKRNLSIFSNSLLHVQGPVLGMDDNVQEKQERLVKQCVRSLGVELGSDEEIELLAWYYVWQSFSNTDPISNISKITERFLDDITGYEQCSHGYLSPNYVIEFSDQVRKIVIGPVEAIRSEYLVANEKEIPQDKTIWNQILELPGEIQAGSKFDCSFFNSRILIELPESCWYIPMGSIKIARRNAEEKAIWSINVAISLLRLCYPNPEHEKYPRVGDIEEMPLIEPKNFWFDSRTEEKGIVLHENDEPTNRASGGVSFPLSSSIRRIPCTYLVDEYSRGTNRRTEIQGAGTCDF